MPPLSLSRAIVYSGFAVGVLDGLYASVSNELRGVSTARVWKYVASGALGRSAFQGGAAMVGVGILMHFAIAFAVAGFFCVSARKLPALTRRIVTSAVIYGVVVHVVMTFVAVPLSAAPKIPFSWESFFWGLVPHVFCVGLPVVWIASKQRTVEITSRVS